jgi:ZIP family zinc transporter
MLNRFFELSAISQTLLGTFFTYFVTALGAGIVFFFKDFNRKVMDAFLGFGAGVMLAASFWSLLSPAIELSQTLGRSGWVVPSVGFVLGGVFVMVSDFMLSKITDKKFDRQNRSESFRRSILLVLAVTIHNIPEGLSVGVAFGSAVSGDSSLVMGGVMLALGIGLQNFPEGACVALPLLREGYSKKRSFFYGQASGMVEPLAGVLGALAAITMRELLPFLLSFAAGAMVAVVASELIPESAMNSKRLCTAGVIMGFVVMMILDVALG